MLVKGPLQLQCRASAVCFMVHITRAAASPLHALEMGCADRHRLQHPRGRRGCLVFARGSVCGCAGTTSDCSSVRCWAALSQLRPTLGWDGATSTLHPGKSTVSTWRVEEFVCKAEVPHRNLSWKQGWPETPVCGQPRFRDECPHTGYFLNGLDY